MIGPEIDGVGVGTSWLSVGRTVAGLSGPAGVGSVPGINISSRLQPESNRAMHSAMAADTNRFIVFGTTWRVPLPPFLFCLHGPEPVRPRAMRCVFYRLRRRRCFRFERLWPFSGVIRASEDVSASNEMPELAVCPVPA